jgi:riboflavin synthase alpha subunit
MEKRVKTIRSELDGQGWERIVTAQQKDEDVGVYVKTRGQEAVEGIVITVLEAKGEAVLVNIVGDIKPEKLAMLGERFNIEPLKKIGPTLEKK